MTHTIKAVCFDFSGVIELSSFVFQKTLNTELLSWFPKLKQQDFSIGILSNAPASVKEEWEIKGIYDTVDTVVISGETGFQKPDKEAFAVLFKQLHVLPHETIFIDDTEKSLEKATEIGYHPILFISNERLKKELQNFGIEL